MDGYCKCWRSSHHVWYQCCLKGYGSSLLPALLLAIVAYYVEKFLNKVIPGVFKPIFVGTLTMAATYAVSILALAPLGQLAGTYVTAAILWLYNIAGPSRLRCLRLCSPTWS